MNDPRYTTAKFTSTRMESAETTPAVSTAVSVVVGVGTKLEVLELVELEVLEVEVVVEEVVVLVGGGVEVVVGDGGGCQVVVGDGGGCQVVVGGSQVVVGGGGGCQVVVGAGAGSEPKFQVPYKTPAERSAKYWKRPCEKSRPPYGHPGHSSVI